MAPPTIIITGASRGLGAATAEILVAHGMNITLNARSKHDSEQIASRVDPTGQRVLVVTGDVGREAACRTLVQRTVHRFGAVDALVNNAGILHPIAPIAEADPASWANNLAVNLFGPFALVHYALPYLRQSRGRVINVSSGASVSVMQGWSAYCAAKAGLNHFTRVLAAEEPGIVALTFRPGVVDTAMQQTIREEGARGMPADSHRRFQQYHEKGELLPPELPGRALATLALAAPSAWSGEFIAWDDERLQSLAAQWEW